MEYYKAIKVLINYHFELRKPYHENNLHKKIYSHFKLFQSNQSLLPLFSKMQSSFRVKEDRIRTSKQRIANS